ncbi:MAG: hypothetical protein P0Y53_16210 [Candidatus Pseudobacter hemicellulosilyticus]|uniref:Beta-lactamase-inhibitor-like PepSY-like domain-containing protein n=1 Tax=Candidatus Pseudobacter hemicellulosilyticus TaxID=3121375 RepID=A0AAJ5WNU2_9BACT|nr:MAG: hypothetical protein P0Y53_16210 [Pseudobacter sp.]
MKNSFKFSLLGICCLFFGTLSAQENDQVNLPPVVVNSSAVSVPEKVWKGFEKYFTDAESPAWYELNKKYMVRFLTQDNRNQALFTRKGQLVYNIYYGNKQDLPDSEWRIIMGSYYDCDITNVLKVTDGRRLVWLVNVENAKNTMMLRIEDGQLEEIQKYKKG